MSFGQEPLQSTLVEQPASAPQLGSLPIYDFGETSIEPEPVEDKPAASLMGMMDSNGREHIEYPPNSGRLWHRMNPDSDWIKD